MVRTQWLAVSLVLSALAAPMLKAQEYVEENGIRYQVTRQVVPRVVTHTRSESRDSTQLQERYTTDMQEVHRVYQAPVTTQQWVPGYQRTWNVFAPPVLTYRLMPVTKWETRQETVRVPSTRRELIPQTVTHQVPVTTQHVATEEVVRKVPVGVSAGGASSLARTGTLEASGDPAGDESMARSRVGASR